MGQYNLVKPILVDHEGALLQLDVNGNLLVAPGAPALWGLYNEDTQAADGSLAQAILAVRNDGASTVLTNRDGDYSWIAVDDRGQVFVRTDPSPAEAWQVLRVFAGTVADLYPPIALQVVGPGAVNLGLYVFPGALPTLTVDVNGVTCTFGAGAPTDVANLLVLLNAAMPDMNWTAPGGFLRGAKLTSGNIVLTGTALAILGLAPGTTGVWVPLPQSRGMVEVGFLPTFSVTNAPQEVILRLWRLSADVGGIAEIAGEIRIATTEIAALQSHRFSFDGSQVYLQLAFLGGAVPTLSGTTEIRVVYDGDQTVESIWVAPTPGADRYITGQVSNQMVAGNILINTRNCSTVQVHANSTGWGTAQVRMQGILADGTTEYVAVYSGVAPFNPFAALIQSDTHGFIDCAGYVAIQAQVTLVNTNAVIIDLEATTAKQAKTELLSKYVEDSAYSRIKEVATAILAVRNDNAAAVLTTADANYSWIAVDDRGQLFVRFSAAAGGPVYAEDTAHSSGDLGFNILAVRRDVAINSAGSDGDYCEFNIDADGHLYVRSKNYDSASNADRVFEVAPVWSHNVATPVTIATALAVTASWVGGDLGPEIPTQGYTKIGLWLNITQNDSQNIRVRALLKHTSAHANEYQLPILSVDTSGPPFNIKAQGEYIEFDVDASQLICLNFDVFNWAPFVQFQVMAEVAGAVPAVITNAEVTYGYGG
jgi:hypothetical protein